MSLSVTNEALTHELERIHAKTEQLRNQSSVERASTIETLVAVIYSLKRLGLVCHEVAAQLHQAAQAIDSELTCSVEQSE